MSTGQVPAHDRVCLIVDPPETPIPLAEFLALHREQGTAMTAMLLGISKQSVLERARGRPWRTRRGKPGVRPTPEQQTLIRLRAIVQRLTALEARLGVGP